MDLMPTETQLKLALEYQANQIEIILANHRVPVRVTGGMIIPRWIRYQAMPEIATKISRIASLSEEIGLHLGVSSVRIARQGPKLHIEIPRPDPGKPAVAVRQFDNIEVTRNLDIELKGLPDVETPALCGIRVVRSN